MYFLFTLSYNSDNISLNDRVDIYVDSADNLSDILYQNGIIQDKDSFNVFLKNKSPDKKHFNVGKKITFKKAMTYEEIFKMIYQSE